jgi:pSer/pThr/pTyr-binding forkhead associated (FHA) protein
MKPRLIEHGPDSQHTREIPIKEAEFLIGRGADCELRLPVADVSRHHCTIRIGRDEATLTDLGSSNGTYVNGQRVRSQTVLHTGDVIRIGDREFVVDLGDRGWLDPSLSGADPRASTVMSPSRKNPPPEKEQGRSPGEASGPGGSGGVSR